VDDEQRIKAKSDVLLAALTSATPPPSSVHGKHAGEESNDDNNA